MKVQLITTMVEFKGLAEAWNALLVRTNVNTIFLTWEWLYTWAKHYVKDGDLRILLAHRKTGDLLGILPLYCSKERIDGMPNVKEIRFLGTEEVGSTYLDVIAKEEHKRDVIQAFYKFLYHELAAEWDVLTLKEVPANSTTLDWMTDCIEKDGKVVHMLGFTVCPVVRLPETLDQVLCTIGRNERYNLSRKRRRLDRKGVVTFRQISMIRDLETWMPSFIGLHQKRWCGKGQPGAFGRKRFAEFHRELLTVMGTKGWCRLQLLCLDQQPIAGIYGFVYDNRFYFYLPGFDPDMAPETSPGILLLSQSVQWAVLERLQEFDLLRGFAPYKLVWASEARRALTLRHYNKHVRASLMGLMRACKDSVKVLVR